MASAFLDEQQLRLYSLLSPAFYAFSGLAQFSGFSAFSLSFGVFYRGSTAEAHGLSPLRKSDVFYCGTSGFSYDDWIGIFYPAGLPRKNWLSYYAQEFNALELNSTYYTLPGASTMESLARKTGGGFLFSVKANQEMTHMREHAQDACKSFVRILQPLVEAKKLGCILAQFLPASYSTLNRGLGEVDGLMGELPLVIEFRTWPAEYTHA
jgi:uncharacterized protein YecE (DUF72 family)